MGRRFLDSDSDAPATVLIDVDNEDSQTHPLRKVPSVSRRCDSSQMLLDAEDDDSSWSPTVVAKPRHRSESKHLGLGKCNARRDSKKRKLPGDNKNEEALLDELVAPKGVVMKSMIVRRQGEYGASDSDSDWEGSSTQEEEAARRPAVPRRVVLDSRDTSIGCIEDVNSPTAVPLSDSEHASNQSKLPPLAKVLARRPHNDSSNSDSSWEYLVLYKGLSYRRVSWVSGEKLVEADPGNARRLRAVASGSSLPPEELLALEDGTHEFLAIDKILHGKEREAGRPVGWKYLVKWRGLGYSEATWELEDELDQSAIDEYWQRAYARPRVFTSDLSSQCRRIATAAAAFDAQLQESDSSEGRHRFVFRPRAPLEIFDFQAAGVRWLLQRWETRRGGCILADEMGLGKTVQAALFLGIVARLWQGVGIGAPFLVVSPLSVLAQWRAELAKWAPELHVVTFLGNQEDRNVAEHYEWWQTCGRRREDRELPGFDVCLTSYDMLQVALSFNERGRRKRSKIIVGPGEHLFTSFPWGVCILDECTRMKNVDSKLRQHFLRAVLPNVDHHVLLTATPIQNDIGELWSLLNIVDPFQFADRCLFEAQYGALNTERCVQELQKELEDCLLQRRKVDVLAELLPKMEEVVINIELTVEQKKLHRAIFEKNLDALRSCTESSTERRLPSLMNLSMQLRKVCNHPFLIPGAEESITQDMNPASDACFQALLQSSGKTVVLDKILGKAWKEGERVLVFSQFTMMLDLLEDFLMWRGYKYDRLDGQVNYRRRQNAIKRFNAARGTATGSGDIPKSRDAGIRQDSAMRVFLISTRAGGLGLNLAAASVCVLFDCDWNPQNDVQAMARCHRIGQDRKVQVYRLITKNTYEAGMFRMASRKLGLTQVVMDSVGTGACDYTSKPSGEDIEQLLRQGAFAAFDVEDDDACCADERSFEEILQSDDVQVLGPDDQNLTDTGTQVTKRFRKMFFGPTPGAIASEIPIDDPNFWTKIAQLPSAKAERQRREQELVSKLGDQYVCKVIKFRQNGTVATITFDAHCDLSLGPMQDPRASRLNGVKPISNHYTVQDATRIAGTLTYEIKPFTKEAEWSFGSRGYSRINFSLRWCRLRGKQSSLGLFRSNLPAVHSSPKQRQTKPISGTNKGDFLKRVRTPI